MIGLGNMEHHGTLAWWYAIQMVSFKLRHLSTFYSPANREVALSFFSWTLKNAHRLARKCWVLSLCHNHFLIDIESSDIASSSGVPVVAVDFSDCQGGKGPTDRMSESCKSHI